MIALDSKSFQDAPYPKSTHVQPRKKQSETIRKDKEAQAIMKRTGGGGR